MSLCIFIGPMNQTESDSVNVSIDSNSFRLDKSWIFLSIAYRRDPGIRVDEGSSESGTTAGSSAVAKKGEDRENYESWGKKVWLLWKFMKGNNKSSQTMEVGVRITCFQACYWWRLLEKEMPFDGRFRPKPIWLKFPWQQFWLVLVILFMINHLNSLSITKKITRASGRLVVHGDQP